MDIIEKLQNLKNLAIAWEAALNCDYVPTTDDAQYLKDNYYRCNVNNLEEILNKYQGCSCDDIESKIITLIFEL